MRSSWEKTPVSQKNHGQVGDTPQHALFSFQSSCYVTILEKLPDTTDDNYTYETFMFFTDASMVSKMAMVIITGKSAWAEENIQVFQGE